MHSKKQKTSRAIATIYSMLSIIILTPGKQPSGIDDITCFSEVLNYYFPPALAQEALTTVYKIPLTINGFFEAIENIDFSGVDAVVTLGLRYYSRVPESVNLIRQRFDGLLCQFHDGSRFDYDSVDLTLTFKNDTPRLSDNPMWFARHVKFNEYVGWAADEKLCKPNQDSDTLTILVDHTAYGDPELVDYTAEILKSIREFIESNAWASTYKAVVVKRFISGQVETVNFDTVSIEPYDRKGIPFSKACEEYSSAHVFCVTHKESVGLVVLETALAGALVVAPTGCIPRDRLETVRHYEYTGPIDWNAVISQINPSESRAVAMPNSWNAVAKNVVRAITKKLTNG